MLTPEQARAAAAEDLDRQLRARAAAAEEDLARQLRAHNPFDNYLKEIQGLFESHSGEYLKLKAEISKKIDSLLHDAFSNKMVVLRAIAFALSDDRKQRIFLDVLRELHVKNPLNPAVQPVIDFLGTYCDPSVNNVSSMLRQYIQNKDQDGCFYLLEKVKTLSTDVICRIFTTGTRGEHTLLQMLADTQWFAMVSGHDIFEEMMSCIVKLNPEQQIECVLRDRAEGASAYNAFAIAAYENRYEPDKLLAYIAKLAPEAQVAIWNSQNSIHCRNGEEHFKHYPLLRLIGERRPDSLTGYFSLIDGYPLRDHIAILQASSENRVIARQLRVVIDGKINVMLKDTNPLQHRIKEKILSMSYNGDTKKQAMLLALDAIKKETPEAFNQAVLTALEDKRSDLYKACNIKRLGGWAFWQSETGSYRAILDEARKSSTSSTPTTDPKKM
jgi:hypothetical protein